MANGLKGFSGPPHNAFDSQAVPPGKGPPVGAARFRLLGFLWSMADDSAGGRLSGKVVNFLFGTVLAALVTTAFTYKTWREQTRLEFAKERLADATKTFDDASQLISTRLFRSYSVQRHIADDDGAVFAKRRDKLDSAIEDWNLAYADLLKRFQFALAVGPDGATRPYADVLTKDFDKHLDCAKGLEDDNRPPHADWSSPSWVLAALNYCLIRGNVAARSDALRAEPASAARDAKIDKLDEDIDNLEAYAAHLRVAGKKAINAIRDSAETHSFWEFLKSW